MSFKPITSDGMLTLTFSKEMKYPESWITKHKYDLKVNKGRLLGEDDLHIQVEG